MRQRKRRDAKGDSLREHGTLNPRAEGVRDELFDRGEFFDARDLVQVKYEMLRRVRVDGSSVAGAAERFGVSRPSFYAAQEAFTQGGLAGLLPRKRGPRGGHKLNPEVLEFLGHRRAADPSVTAPKLVELVFEHFGIRVHQRSIERALRRPEKKP